MNNVNRKFKCLITNDYKILEKRLNDQYEIFEKEKTNHLPAIDKYRKIKNKTPDLILKYSNLVEIYKVSWKKEFYENNKEDFEYLEKLKNILSIYNKSNCSCFIDFDVLQSYFDKYRLPVIEQGQILAYFININILYFKNYRYRGNEEEVEVFIKKIVEDKYGKKKSKKEKRQEVLNGIKEFDNNQEICYRRYKELRIIINEEGEIIPHLEAESFWELETILKYDLNPLQAKNILTASSELAKLIKAAEEAEKNERNNKLKAKIQYDIEKEKRLQKDKEARMSLNNAKKELEQYLMKDIPICYIEDIDYIISLLNQIGYTKSDILKIKKLIIEYNKKFINKREQALFDKAKHKYLITSEISLLNMVENIITNPDSIKNPLYDEIKEMYNNIRERLIYFGGLQSDEDLEFNYETEYMLLCLTELTSLLTAYRETNYKLILKKNSDLNN